MKKLCIKEGEWVWTGPFPEKEIGPKYGEEVTVLEVINLLGSDWYQLDGYPEEAIYNAIHFVDSIDLTELVENVEELENV